MASFGYTARGLLQVSRTFAAHPEAVFTIPGVWPEERLDRSAWREWFRSCLDRKISAGGAKAREARVRPRGRKDCYSWDLDMRRAQSLLNRPRLILHWLPRDLKTRFGHRLRSAMDD